MRRAPAIQAKVEAISEDRTGGDSPLEGLMALVVGCDEMLGTLRRCLDASEGATTDGFVNDHIEEAINLIDTGPTAG